MYSLIILNMTNNNKNVDLIFCFLLIFEMKFEPRTQIK